MQITRAVCLQITAGIFIAVTSFAAAQSTAPSATTPSAQKSAHPAPTPVPRSMADVVIIGDANQRQTSAPLEMTARMAPRRPVVGKIHALPLAQKIQTDSSAILNRNAGIPAAAPVPNSGHPGAQR